jgi:hypothetical protein
VLKAKNFLAAKRGDSQASGPLRKSMSGEKSAGKRAWLCLSMSGKPISFGQI